MRSPVRNARGFSNCTRQLSHRPPTFLPSNLNRPEVDARHPDRTSQGGRRAAVTDLVCVGLLYRVADSGGLSLPPGAVRRTGSPFSVRQWPHSLIDESSISQARWSSG